LVNIRKVAVFIDDIMVGMEEEEGHDELVEEVIRRLAENNLYIKPEKYKWKVRKVEFLGVVIGLERIKIEEDKVKGVLDWLTPKCVKNIQKFLGLANYYCQFIKDYTTGEVLFMECEDEKWRLVAFLSKSLNETKRNYEIHNKEILVVIRGLEN